MKNAKLKKQFTNTIGFHYDRELWHSRPEQSYEESIGPFVDDLIRIATGHKYGWNYKPYKYDESELLLPTITGQEIGEKIRKLRLTKGWPVAQLAKKADLDTEYLNSIERGEPILRIWALERILDALKVRSSAVLPF